MVKTGLVPHESVEQKEDWKIMKKAAFTTSNEKGTLMYNQANKNNILGALFKSFTMLDLMEIIHIKEMIKEKIFVPSIDIKMTLADFNGQTFFEIFKND